MLKYPVYNSKCRPILIIESLENVVFGENYKMLVHSFFIRAQSEIEIESLKSEGPVLSHIYAAYTGFTEKLIAR